MGPMEDPKLFSFFNKNKQLVWGEVSHRIKRVNPEVMFNSLKIIKAT